jgi:hypothetical protein
MSTETEATSATTASPAPDPNAPIYPNYMSMREHHTVLAALRFWQRASTRLFGVNYEPEYEIATNSGAVEPLSCEEIDSLCEDLNCGGRDPEVVAQLREPSEFSCK